MLILNEQSTIGLANLSSKRCCRCLLQINDMNLRLHFQRYFSDRISLLRTERWLFSEYSKWKMIFIHRFFLIRKIAHTNFHATKTFKLLYQSNFSANAVDWMTFHKLFSALTFSTPCKNIYGNEGKRFYSKITIIRKSLFSQEWWLTIII